MASCNVERVFGGLLSNTSATNHYRQSHLVNVLRFRILIHDLRRDTWGCLPVTPLGDDAGTQSPLMFYARRRHIEAGEQGKESSSRPYANSNEFVNEYHVSHEASRSKTSPTR